MAYLPGFEHDIFISFSHVDNLSASGQPWVDQFQKNLEIAVAQRVGRMGLVKIWRDPKLEGDQLFDDTIESAIRESGLFVALNSSGYMASEYCQKELRCFHEKADAEPGGLRVGDRWRIYNVLLNNIPHDQWPKEFGRISGHPFHASEDPDDRGEPTDPELDKKRFREQLKALSDSLYKMLEAYREALSKPARAESAQPTPAAQAGAGDGGLAVYVADVSDSASSTRKRVVSELQRQGLEVLGGVPPPYDAAGHREKVQECLKRAALSVHLLDQYAGRTIDGEPERSYPQKQVDLARGEARACWIWVPQNLDLQEVEDEAHREFLNGLESGEREEGEFEFVRGLPANLVPQIVERAREIEKEGAAEGPSGSVLLDTHLRDQLHALELSKVFLEHGIQPFVNPQADDPTQNMDVLEARLREVSMLMILYGSVNRDWVLNRLGAALQLKVVKNLPVQSFWVYSVPPEKEGAALEFDLGPVQVHLIDNSGSPTLDPALLAPVFEKVGARGAA